ncbi:MAG: hypothetical protein AAF624_00995 [Bacteroidota bacterium]
MDDALSAPEPLPHDADSLGSWLDAADGFARAHLVQVRTRLRSEVAGPLTTLLAELAREHRTYLDQLPTGPDLALPDRSALWGLLTTYRLAVEDRILARLHDALERWDLPDRIEEATLAPFEYLALLAHEAPERHARIEPGDLLVATPGDTSRTRLRKRVARSRRALGERRRGLANGLRSLVRSEPTPAPVLIQTVRLRALLDYHAQVRLGVLFGTLHETAQQAVAATLADTTEALNVWMHALLRAEAALDRAVLHDLDLAWPDEVIALKTAPETEGTVAASLSAATDVPSDPLSADERALVRAALDAALVLQRALDDAYVFDAATPFAEAEAALDAAHAVLHDDVDRSSPYQLRPARALPPEPQRPEAHARSRAKAWHSWHPKLEARLTLMRTLLDLRALLLTELDTLVGRVGQSGLRPVLRGVQDVVDDLLGLSEEAERACQAAAANDDVAGLTVALRGLLSEAVTKTAGQLVRRLQSSSLSAALERGLSAAESRITTAVDDLPDHLSVAADLTDRPLDPTKKAERAVVQPMARTVLDQSFLARLGEGGEALKQPLFRVLAKAEEVQSAVHYNLDAALEELGSALPDDTTTVATSIEPSPSPDNDLDLLSMDASYSEEAAAEVDASSETEVPPPTASAAEASPSSGDSTPTPAAIATETGGDDSDQPGVSAAERIASARELTVTGLARAAERLAGIVEPLHDPWTTFLAEATQVFERRWGMLHQRIEAAGVEGQFMDVKLRMADEGARMGREAQNQVRVAGQRLAKEARRWWKRALSLIRRGRSAAGLTQNVAARQATLDALGEISVIRQRLPLVYRRLFSFDPIADPLLLQGRDAQLDSLSTVLNRWQAQQPSSALVVTAPMGGGATSFLRVAAGTLLTGLPLHRVDLTERLADPEVLADALAQAFDVDLAHDDDTGLSRLARLERHLLAGPDQPQRVCLLEHLEHLMLRTGGGLAPLETTLTFLSRTDHRVLWFATMNESAWRFMARTAPALTGLVTPLSLPPLDRTALETLILKRHARSGLPLTFDEPQAPAPLLVRRLKNAKNEAARQDLLRADFFDRLARASGRSIALALFYWLRSLDFEAAGDRLTVRSLPALDFGFLASYDLPRAFALKALLQHGTLTLGEYQRVFRSTPREGYLLFESLANELLITRANGTTNATAPGAPMSVRLGDRYRIHPLLVHPVAEALRSRNML